MDMNPENQNSNNVDPEKEVENLVDSITEDVEHKNFNFLINASNQANLFNTKNKFCTQVNALFVLIHPFSLESFKLDGLGIDDLNLELGVKGDNTLIINGKEFTAIDVEPGIRIFGISRNSEE